MELSRKSADFPPVYASFEQIPEERRLCTYEDQFTGRDVWGEYIDDQYIGEDGVRNFRQRQLAERMWKQYCEEQNCHHALTSPTVINEWCEELLETRKPITVSKGYLRFLNTFHRYLMWNVEYPHTYNPVQFATSEFETVSQVEGLYRSDTNE